nr:hypothetical protein [Tanacetum cinerariifolium]
MHINIMTAGSRDYPSMLATGQYEKWRSRFLRYVDTRLNGNSLTKCILEGPYTHITVVIQPVPAIENSPAVSEHTTTAHEIWEAIERLQQGESFNIQDVKTNLFWKFRKFTSHDGETMESYYTRFVTMVKQQHKLDEVSNHKLFDILKQYQKEVNELCAKRIARNANPLALVATAQPHQDSYYQTSKSHNSYAPTSKTLLQTRSHATTRHKGKEIAKPIIPPSESAFEEDSDPEQAQKDKEMQKHLALIAKYFKKIYKPTNNSLRTYSNNRNKNEAIEGQRLRVSHGKDVAVQTSRERYMAKIQEVPTSDSGIDSKPLEQVQYDAGYNVFANDIQHSEQRESISNTCVVETGDSNFILDLPDMCNNDIQKDQNIVECDDEQTSRTLRESNSIRDSFLVALQNKQTEFERYKAFNDCTVDYDKLECKLNETLGLLAQKDNDIKEGLKLKAYEILVIKKKHDELVKQSLLTKSHYEGLVIEKTKIIMDLKLKEENDTNKMISMEKQLKFLNKIVYKKNQSIQTTHMMAPKGLTFNGRPTFANPMYLKKAQSQKRCLYAIPNDQSDPANRLVPNREETQTLERENDTLTVPEQTTVKTLLTMSPENKDHYESKKEAIRLLLTRIGDEIYSTVDACKTAHDMWIAIEMLQQGESLNIQDVKTNLFWEFGKYTSHDGESMESYYSGFYKMMNEMLGKNLTVATMKSKRLKDYTYHKEKMLLCKQAEKAHYSYMAKIQEVPTAEYNVFANEKQHFEQSESISNTYVVEKVDSNVIPDSLNMCDNDIQTDKNAEECNDKRVMLANLIANLKLDIDENKKIQKQLKKANTSLAHELKKCKSILVKTNRTLGESNSTRDSFLIVLPLIPKIFVNSSKLLDNQVNRSTKGYHEVPPPLTGNYMPPKHDLRLIDEQFEIESVDVSTVSSNADKTVNTIDITHKVIQDPEETATASVNVYSEVKSKDKGKGILIEEPKPLKRQAQIEQDEAFTRQLEAELNANINWDDVMEQARKNMMIYLKNIVGFKMDFFKGMTYNEIRPIFEKHYNSIQAFLEKGENEIKEEGNKRKANDDDDVYTEATPLALKGNPHQALKDKGVIDSVYSKHMTWNISYLFDFEEINGGYVAFGGNTKGGKITGKDTECAVLSSNFKPPDENHVLLRVPRENNMYNVDLKNIVPLGDLTCLFGKATLDESNLWHKRLGYINFKTMNKLVKGNLVRGLPSKVFENNHTCVACKKGKQHRASWSGPTWLFDIDTLTQSMNYQPVVAGNQPNSSAGIKENFNAGTVGKEPISTQQYVLLPLWSTSSKDPHNIDDDAAFADKENKSEVYVSPSSSDKPKKHDDKANREAKGKSHVDVTPITTVGPNSTNNTNSFNAVGPSNTAVSPTFEICGKSSFVDPSQYPDDPDMPALEDITYLDDEEDVGAEANFSNLETNITVKEPKRVHQALKDPSWIEATQEELLQFKMQKEEHIDYEEVFAPVTRIEAIRLFLAYASFMGFMVYQMDVKSAFLYGAIKEEVYVCQPPGFEDPDYPDKVYKVVKAFYGLHQAPRAWKFGLTEGKLASTPIETKKPLLKDLDVTPKVSHLHAIKRIFRYLKGKPNLGFWYPKDSSFNLVAYSDSDYARASLDRKSTTRGCQFLGSRLISWQCKKQTVVAISSTEAEYVAAASCYA